MKRILFIVAAITIAATTSAQITAVASTKTVAMYDQKDTWLNMTIGADGDTTYAIRLRSTYAYSNTAEVFAGAQEKSHVLIDLGKREQAVAILRSMIDFNGADRTLVTLNNPSENAAVYSNGIRGRGFIVADRWNIEKEFVSVKTLENILCDIQSIQPGIEIADQLRAKQSSSAIAVVGAMIVGIGVALYFTLSAFKK